MSEYSPKFKNRIKNCVFDITRENEGKDFITIIKEITGIVDSPISTEIISLNSDDISYH